MFLNKMKEQQDKSVSFPTSSPSHYQTAVLTIPTSGTKTDGGGQAGIVAPVHPPHSAQNLLPVPSTGIMTAGVFLSIKILWVAPIWASSSLYHRMTNCLVTIMHFNITKPPINPKGRYEKIWLLVCSKNVWHSWTCPLQSYFVNYSFPCDYFFWFVLIPATLGWSRPGHHHSSGDSRLSHIFSIICLWSSSCNDYDCVGSSFTW